MEKMEKTGTTGFDPLGLELAFQPPPDEEDFENAVQAPALELLDDPFAGESNWDTISENFEAEAGSAHSFKGCSPSEKNILIDAADRSLLAVRHAASFVGSAYGRPDKMSADTRRLLLEHFHTVKRDDLRFVLTRLMRIAKALEEGIAFKAERSCPATPSGMECGYANTSMWFGGSGDVRLCFDARPGHCNFASSSGPRQERILIHEVCHRYVGINDKAYHHLPAYKTLTPSQAMDNADSYAFFAVDARATLSEAEDLDRMAEEPATDYDEFFSEASDDALEESAILDGQWPEAEGETFSPQQVDFRDRVLGAHIASKKRKPFTDLDPGRLAKIPGTDVETLASTAEAAGRVLTAANAALRQAQARGDADALRTRRIGISSGYRSFAHQCRRWMELFPKYYRQSQAVRQTLPGGEHSDAAVAYLLRPRKAGGFGLAGNIGAPGFSNHQSGIAVDFFQYRASGHAISNSTAPSARARWRATWFYRWLKENAPRFKFKQLETEEWHWEYQGNAVPAQPSGAALRSSQTAQGAGDQLWTYRSEITRAPVSLFLPPAALRDGQMDVLLYVHGLLGPCPRLPSVPDGFISGEQFALGKIATGSGLPMAVVVPLLQGGRDRNWESRGLDKPAQINALINEVMTEIARHLGRPARLADLVIAGHSRGFGVIYPLARSSDMAKRQGALARLKGLLMLDASYGTVPLRELNALASAPGGPEVRIVYRTGSPTDKFQGRKSQGRMRLMPVPSSISHCALPAKVLGSLLAGLPTAKGTSGEDENGWTNETWESDPTTATEWTEAGLEAEDDYSGGPLDLVEPEEDDRETDFDTRDNDQLDWLDYEADISEANEDDAYLEASAGQVDETFEPWQHEDPASFEDEEASGITGEALDALNQFIEHEAAADLSLADRLKGSATFLLGPVLQQSARGDGVMALQRALMSLGYPVCVDGTFGVQTGKAVRQFQSRSALPADGVVGSQTKTAIAAALTGHSYMSPAPAQSLPMPPQPIDGETIDAFAGLLAQEWSSRSAGHIDPAEKRSALLSDHQLALEGARRRYGSKYPVSMIDRAWKISRQNEMLFKTEQQGGIKPLGTFAPPAQRVQLVSDPLIDGSNEAPVAPSTVRFARELAKRFASVSVSTYRGHGSQGFVDRGYSVDLFIPGRDDRGFYRQSDAIALMRAVDGAAKAIDAEWRIIYNDFAVARAINREFGRRHVIFVGQARADKKGRVALNWHGPAPLILHFHLDLAVREGSEKENETSGWEGEGNDFSPYHA